MSRTGGAGRADPLTRAGVVAMAAARLAGISSSAALDAELLAVHALGIDRAALRARPGAAVSAAGAVAVRALVNRRRLGEPVAYLIGVWGFHAIELGVGHGALVPRPETEGLVERALEIAGPEARVLDLGAGTGAVALAIAQALPAARITAVESSPGALALARPNVARLGRGRVEIVAADWHAARLETDFDLVVANPPYVAAGDAHLAREGARFEPPAALVAGAQGFDAIDSLLPVAHRALAPGGTLLVEHGHAQGAGTRARFERAGFGAARTHRDLVGHERITEGRRSRLRR